MTDLRLYNTLSRTIEPFRPRSPGRASVYSCGPTVYSRQHLGNMRPYVSRTFGPTRPTTSRSSSK